MSFFGCERCSKTKGYLIDLDNESQLYAKKCQCLIDYQKEQLLQVKVVDSNLPKDIINYDIGSYKGNKSLENIDLIKLYIKKFKNEFKNYNLYFHGTQGTQKTTLAKYIGVSLLKQGFSCYYVLADSLIKLLLDANMDEEKKEIIDIILNKDFLIIDEISDDKCTIYKSEYQIPFFTSFLKSRLELIKKSTVFISNYSIDQLYSSKFGKTISDLINRECNDKLLFKDNYYFLTVNDVKNMKSKLRKMMGD